MKITQSNSARRDSVASTALQSDTGETAIVGIQLTSEGGSYTPNPGSSYLLPAYAAAFLGAACFRPGEFNIPGTAVGVLFLGTISTGLTIVNLQTYLINLVQGVILIAAVLLGRLGQRNTT